MLDWIQIASQDAKSIYNSQDIHQKIFLNIDDPRIGLLNVGEEEGQKEICWYS